MSLLELPHTRGCLVCGQENPHGLKLHLHVGRQSGVVSCEFTPEDRHIGFEGIVHGGLLSTVLDEAMVWAATWSGKRFCVCGELNVRFRQSVPVGQLVRVEAMISSARSRLIEARGVIRDGRGTVLTESEGKYVPVALDRNREFVATLVARPQNYEAIEAMRAG